MPLEFREDLLAFLTSGISLLIGTRDAQNRPTCMRAFGVTFAADRKSFALFLPSATAGRTLSNLRDNGRIAVTFSRPTDLKSVQIKGACIGIRPATTADESIQAAYFEALMRELEQVGFPRERVARVTWRPSMAVDVRPEAVFEQTPGPAAGRRIDETER